MRFIGKLSVGLGALFLICGIGLTIFSYVSTKNAKDYNAEIVTYLEELLPVRSEGVREEYASMQMPAVEIDGRDIIGMIEFPNWNAAFAIANEWDAKTLYSLPQRFSGTVYDDSLVVGGRDQEGQFDLLKRVDLGNTVIVTDMTGAQFFYEVEKIERKKTAEMIVFEDESSKLSLFMRDEYSMEYIIVRCK